MSCGNNNGGTSSGGNEPSTEHVYTPSEIFAEVNKSTVFVLLETLTGYSSGTGFFIDDNGTFATNYHVIEDAVEGLISDYNGNSYAIDCVKGYNEAMDIAICSSSATNTHSARLGNSDTVAVGDNVFAIGYPQAFSLGASSSTFTSGMVSMYRSIDGYSYIQATVDITNGNSGGPLINNKAEVIGITSGGIKFNDIDYMNLSIPINVIIR